MTNANQGQGAAGEFQEGDLKISITDHRGNVVINFDAPVTSIGMPPEQARQFARMIIKRASFVREGKPRGS